MKNHNKYSQVNPIKVNSGQTVEELLSEFKSSGVFGPGRIAEAIEVFTEMLQNKATVFLGIAGALIPGGMRKVLVDLIRNDMVNVIVSTGANVTHDLIEVFGGRHIHNVPYTSDAELREKSIDRIYDAFVSDDSFMKLEDGLQPIFQEIWDEKSENQQLSLTTYKLLEIIGSKISDKDSFVLAAYEKKIPIFVPAFSDSILGLQLWLFSQTHKVFIDVMGDLSKIQQIASDSDKAGTFFLGGGVPKNYIFQSRLMSPKTYEYAIQITMDRVETGGLSGASLSEAISWGKTSGESKMVTVVSDITIALPLIFAGTLANIQRDE